MAEPSALWAAIKLTNKVEDAIRIHQKFSILGLVLVTHKFLFRERHGPICHSICRLLGFAVRCSEVSTALSALPSTSLFLKQSQAKLWTWGQSLHTAAAPALLSTVGYPNLPHATEHATQHSRPLFTVWLVMTDTTSIFLEQILIAYISTQGGSKHHFQAAFWQILGTCQFWSDLLTGPGHKAFSTASPPRITQPGVHLPFALMQMPRINASSSLPHWGVLTHQPFFNGPRKHSHSFFQETNGALKTFILPLNFSWNQNGKRRNNNWDLFELSRLLLELNHTQLWSSSLLWIAVMEAATHAPKAVHCGAEPCWSEEIPKLLGQKELCKFHYLHWSFFLATPKTWTMKSPPSPAPSTVKSPGM